MIDEHSGELSTLLDWRSERETTCGLRCRDVLWTEGRSWCYDGDRLEHETGRFFSIVGRRFHSNLPWLEGIEQAMIDQPEIGILGLLLRRGSAGTEILLQAKAEPGNINRVQIAPTVQATVSNYTRVHGGAATPYLELFLSPPTGGVVADTLQSEQGTRFLSKYNRNLAVVVDGGPAPVSDVWRWVPVTGLLAALHHPLVVNTDARSTLVASDWSLLANREAFSRWRGEGGFGELLLESFEARPSADPLEVLEGWRDEVELASEAVRIDRLDGWRHDGMLSSERREPAFSVPMVRVHAPDREVTAWDQPLVRNHEPAVATLICQVREGLLRFRLHGSAEPGFGEKVQFGPANAGLAPAGTIIASCRQSDEGGRFDRCIVDYRVVRLPGGVEVAPSECATWATLSDIRRLLTHTGACNNELRSALSLLLAWL